MDWMQIIVLGLVQGLTEFLPVSSSAHLVLAALIMGWQDQGLLMDVAAHAGSLLAVLIYFRTQLFDMQNALFNSQAENRRQTLRLMAGIIIATIPIIVSGLIFADHIEKYTRSGQVIALTTIAFALLLGCADRIARQSHDEYALAWRAVIFIGCAQAFALIPGASRAGVTMTAALMMGLTKVAAARFSFLLSIPAILAAVGYKSMQLFGTPLSVNVTALLTIFILSGMVAYLCIDAFIRFVSIVGMMPFVIYRIILGVLLLAFV